MLYTYDGIAFLLGEQGTVEGELATSGSVNGEFVMAFHPDNWYFLEYEQVLQVSAMTTGWDWDSNGTPIQVPVNKTFNFKVSMSGNSLWLENVDNPDSITRSVLLSAIRGAFHINRCSGQ